MPLTFRFPAPFDHVPIEFGPLSVDPTTLTWLSDVVQADDHVIVFSNDFLTIAIHGSSKVEVDVVPGTHPDVVEAMLYGYVMRMLFLQSGVFNLHASLLRLDQGDFSRTVAIAGHSGAGKSTTVTALSNRPSVQLLVDDVLPMTVTNGVVIGHPFRRPVHLLPEAARRLRLDAQIVGDGTVIDGLGELVCDLASDSGAVTIDRVVILERGLPDASEVVAVREVRGAERLRLLVRHSNATGVASFGPRSDAYLDWVTSVASLLPMMMITRPPDIDTLDEVVGHVARLLRAET